MWLVRAGNCAVPADDASRSHENSNARLPRRNAAVRVSWVGFKIPLLTRAREGSHALDYWISRSALRIQLQRKLSQSLTGGGEDCIGYGGSAWPDTALSSPAW